MDGVNPEVLWLLMHCGKRALVAVVSAEPYGKSKSPIATGAVDHPIRNSLKRRAQLPLFCCLLY